jgi:dienelactone hydrolase
MTGGWREAEDVLAAAEYLLASGRTTTVGAMGFSLGGAAVLLAAAHERAPELLASGVFAESAFVDAREVVRLVERNPGVLARKYIPYWLFRLGLEFKFARQGHRRTGMVEYLANVAAPHYGVSGEELYRLDSVLPLVDRIRVPVFHLHAVDDWIVPVEHALRLRDAAERAGNGLVGVCVRSRGAHCAFQRVTGAWRDRVARDFFFGTSGVAVAAEPSEAHAAQPGG